MQRLMSKARKKISWRMQRHRKFLEKWMTSDFGLLDKLWQNGSISDIDIQKVKAPAEAYKRNRKLIDIISKRKNHQELFEALKTSGQAHLVNYLATDGTYSVEFGDIWPLEEKESLTLQCNHGTLVDNLKISDVLGHLHTTGVINKRQRDFINSKPTPYKKNEALLDILRRCSLGGYRQTIRCLHASNQSHIAEILEYGSEIGSSPINPSVNESIVGQTLSKEQRKKDRKQESNTTENTSDLPVHSKNLRAQDKNFENSEKELGLFMENFQSHVPGLQKEDHTEVIYSAESSDESKVSTQESVSHDKQETEETPDSRATLAGSQVKSTAVETSEISVTDIVQLFNRHRRFLEEHIDPNFGILDKLLSGNILTNKEIEEIKKHLTTHERNARLLDFILQKNRCDQFIRTLSDEKQIHIVNYLLSNGEYKPEFGGEWPLTQQEVRTLDYNQQDLVDLLDTCDLIGRLYSRGVINTRQRDFISSKQVAFEKNEALLQILRRSSLNTYWHTIICLHLSNQSHIAEMLAKGGVLVRVDASLEGEGLNVSQAESEVIEVFTNLLSNRPLPERSRIYELIELSLAGVSLGHSVSLYFHCLGLSDLERFEHLIENGRLRDIVETVFTRFIKGNFSVKLKFNVERFNKCRKFFAIFAPKTSNVLAQTFQQHIEFLEENIDPDSGLLDKLQSSRTLSFKETSDIKDQHPFYKRNSLLLQYIRDKDKYDSLINALKESGQSHIVNFLNDDGEYIPEKCSDDWPLTESELSVLDENKEFLINVIEIENLVLRLYLRDVINKRQREAISSKLASYEKNEALLEILRRRSLKDFKLTIRCLHDTNQSHLAEILEQAEVAMRTHEEGLDDESDDEIIRESADYLTNKLSKKSRRMRESS